MASSDVQGFDGAATVAGHGGQARGFTFKAAMRTKDVSRYGGNRFPVHRGGLIDCTGTVRVIARKGASGDAPAATTLEAEGSALVLTASTSCTWSFTALLSYTMEHNYDDPAIEATYDFTATGSVVEAWLTS